ncbi:DUF397 domain-containing protein [Streptomyces sp. NPDC059122]|uniref:DUF397 domain-containing protein n=1 Tax=Streptomyces sp. NPDC059122 TaxID=3346732 RepID=UPI0036C6CB7C
MEVSDDHAVVAPVRGSKDPRGPALVFRAAAWSTFIDGIKVSHPTPAAPAAPDRPRGASLVIRALFPRNGRTGQYPPTLPRAPTPAHTRSDDVP